LPATNGLVLSGCAKTLQFTQGIQCLFLSVADAVDGSFTGTLSAIDLDADHTFSSHNFCSA